MVRTDRANFISLTKVNDIYQELKVNRINAAHIISREPMFHPPYIAHYAINIE